MTTFTTPATTSTRRPRHVRAARIGRWAVRIVLSAQFVLGGVLKLVADPTMVAMFDDIGAGAGLRLLIGACEVAGAVGLLVPRLVRPAAAGLVLLMIGAAVTNVVVVASSPVLPIVLGALAVVVAVGHGRTGGRR